MSGQDEVYGIWEDNENADIVQAKSILDGRDYIRLECDGCGAPLPSISDPECEYCGAKYAKIRRYSGPEIPEAMLHTNLRDGFTANGSCVISTATSMSYSTSACFSTVPAIRFERWKTDV